MNKLEEYFNEQLKDKRIKETYTFILEKENLDCLQIIKNYKTVIDFNKKTGKDYISIRGKSTFIIGFNTNKDFVFGIVKGIK